jgi:hypothetical protein
MRVDLGITNMFDLSWLKGSISNFILYISTPRGKELSNPNTSVKITADIWFVTACADMVINRDFVPSLTVDIKNKKFILERDTQEIKIVKRINSAKNLDEVFQAIERKLHDQA